jgi:molybdenum cofactor cytidylyltransferase
MRNYGTPSLIGILLAAGKGSRFDPAGVQNKLLQPLVNGDTVVASAAKNLLAVLPTVLAVVRPGQEGVASQLQALGCQVTVCPTADQGMAASLVHALSHARQANGWMIALADMPYVRPATIRALAEAIEAGAQIAAPIYQGQRGNPVAFARMHLPQLLLLRGDEGARRLLNTFPVTEVVTDDPGIRLDIDTVVDLDGVAPH